MKIKKIRIETLAENNLKDLPALEGPPESCRYCLYWEFPRDWNRLQSDQGDCLKRKAAWIKTLAEGFGPAGKVIYIEEQCIGYCQYAPVEYLPAGKEHPTGAVSQDAVLLSCLFIADARFRKKGLGTRLLKAACAELKTKGVKAIETFGRKGNPENPSGPVEFYLKAGFRIMKDDAEYPLLRLELQSPVKPSSPGA